MIKDYYYRLLSKYISVYARTGDKVLFVEPRRRSILNKFSSEDILVVTNDPGQFRGYNTVGDIQSARQFTPNFIVLDGNLQREGDVIKFLEDIHSVCTSSTRVIITYYSMLWRPIGTFAASLDLRDRVAYENWITPEDTLNFALLTEFERVKNQIRILLPLKIPFFSNFFNRWFAPLPFFKYFSLLNFEIFRPIPQKSDESDDLSASVIIPMRNESGNVKAAFDRIPIMGPNDELIFVEGNSTDDTWEELQRCRDEYAQTDQRTIKITQQEGKGKKDAVYKGFSMAENNILMILDGDLTVPPEDLTKFYSAIVCKKGEFINGCRLVYSLENEAMRFLNIVGNKLFAIAFSYVLGQNLKDTLCGTKVFTRDTFARIQANQTFFGDFDPFGDFDLIFGADRLGLKILEVPVRYRARTYGDTNISRFRHGWILLKMLVFVSKKLKFV